MTRIARAWWLLCVLFLFLFPHSAHASLQVCNHTSYILYTAEGWTTGADNITQGWTRIVPGSCAAPISGLLTAKSYFLYARSSQAHGGPARAWGGNVELCAKDTNFSLATPTTLSTCSGNDTLTMPFALINTHNLQSWTATLTETNSIHTDDQARTAGLDRLLRDNGFKVTNAKDREAAINRFKAKIKLASNAGDADLFDALETEAMKASSPAGYSICNDTPGETWVALGFRAGKQSLAAGWWRISPGACAHALTEPLKLDKVYIHAEGHNRPQLVSGKEKFCVTNITFQISSDADCKRRGLSEAGFAATNTQGRTGYTAHIGNSGLLPAPSQVAMPK